MNIETEIEIIKSFYETARQEIIARINSRDNSLLIYLGGVGAIIAASFQTDSTLFLLIIPFLALGISTIISHHHAMIGGLALYCSIEIGEKFKELEVSVEQWDNSAIRMNSSDYTIRLRYLGDILLVNIPGLMAIIASYNEAIVTNENLTILIFSIICLIGSMIIMGYSYFSRKSLFRKMVLEINNKNQEKKMNTATNKA